MRNKKKKKLQNRRNAIRLLVENETIYVISRHGGKNFNLIYTVPGFSRRNASHDLEFRNTRGNFLTCGEKEEHLSSSAKSHLNQQKGTITIEIIKQVFSRHLAELRKIRCGRMLRVYKCNFYFHKQWKFRAESAPVFSLLWYQEMLLGPHIFLEEKKKSRFPYTFKFWAPFFTHSNNFRLIKSSKSRY